MHQNQTKNEKNTGDSLLQMHCCMFFWIFDQKQRLEQKKMRNFLEKRPELNPGADICIIYEAVITRIRKKFAFHQQFEGDPTLLPNYDARVPHNQVMFISYIAHNVCWTRSAAQGRTEPDLQIMLSSGKVLPSKQYLSPDTFIDDWKLLVVNAEKYHRDAKTIGWANRIVAEVCAQLEVCFVHKVYLKNCIFQKPITAKIVKRLQAFMKIKQQMNKTEVWLIFVVPGIRNVCVIS